MDPASQGLPMDRRPPRDHHEGRDGCTTRQRLLPRNASQAALSEPGSPDDHGAVIEAAGRVEVALAEPSPSRLRPLDLWSALGTSPRASFELVMTVPLRPTPISEIAPPVETITVGINDAPPGAPRPVTAPATGADA